MRFATTLKLTGPIALAGHDIGGAVAQHLLAHDQLAVSRLALVNSVTYDSWPAHLRFVEGLVELAQFHATEQRITDYLKPWTEPRVRRSWLAMAGAAHSRYTLDLVPALQRSTMPKLLLWGEDDAFEKVEYAEKFVVEIPRTTLIRIPEAKHIPTENAPDQIAQALIDLISSRPR